MDKDLARMADALEAIGRYLQAIAQASRVGSPSTTLTPDCWDCEQLAQTGWMPYDTAVIGSRRILAFDNCRGCGKQYVRLEV